jgi:hypothetical protein
MAKKKVSKRNARSMDERVKKLDTADIALTKWSVVAVVLFLITAWPALLELVLRVHWGWYLGAAILLALRPMKRFWRKK